MGWGTASALIGNNNRKIIPYVAYSQTTNTNTQVAFNVTGAVQDGDGNGYCYNSQYGVEFQLWYRTASGSNTWNNWIQLGSDISTATVGNGTTVGTTTRSTGTINRTHSSFKIQFQTYIIKRNFNSTSVTVETTINPKPSHTIVYNANVPTGTTVTGMPSQQTAWCGESLTIGSAPTRANYNFKGWALSATGSKAYDAGQIYTKDKNDNSTSTVTLYALWELAYTNPKITNLQVFRTEDNISTTLDDTGTWMRISFNWSIDTTIDNNNHWTRIIIQAKRKTDSDTPANWKTLVNVAPNSGQESLTSYANNMSFDDISTNTTTAFDIDTSYDIKIILYDNHLVSTNTYGSITNTTILSQGYFLLDFSPTGGIGIGTVAPDNIKLLQVGITPMIDNKALWLRSTNLTSNTSVTANGESSLCFIDSTNTRLGYVDTYFKETNQYTRLMTQRQNGTTTAYNGIYLGLDSSGNPIDAFQDTASAKAFQKALKFTGSTSNDYGAWNWIIIDNFAIAQWRSIQKSVTSAGWTSWGSMYYKDFGSLSFPSALKFTNAPQVSVTYTNTGNATLLSMTDGITTSSISHIYAWRPAAYTNTTALTFYTCATVIGPIS